MTEGKGERTGEAFVRTRKPDKPESRAAPRAYSCRDVTLNGHGSGITSVRYGCRTLAV